MLLNKLSFFLLITLFACSFIEYKLPPTETYTDYSVDKIPYLLNEPDTIFKLPWMLEEISGLTYVGDHTLVSVQDEEGIIYYIDALSGSVSEKKRFGSSGDYEGVELLKNSFWVMESNGAFHSFRVKPNSDIKSKKMTYGFTSKNDLEGLGQHNGKLLIACKADGSVGPTEVKGKGIYKIAGNKPKLFIAIRQKELNSFVENKKYFNEVKDFDPSAIAVHPSTGDIYILSADHVLVVYDKSLNLKEVAKLNKKLFIQPEGITFSPEGTLYLTSEGNGSKGRLFVLSSLIK